MTTAVAGNSPGVAAGGHHRGASMGTLDAPGWTAVLPLSPWHRVSSLVVLASTHDV